MTTGSADAAAAAQALLSQYGDDAAVIAIMRAAEVAALGDLEALAHWDAVIALIETDGPTGVTAPRSAPH